MRTGDILFSAIHFFVVLVIASTGGFFIAVAKIARVRFFFSHLFSEKYEIFFPIGASLLVFTAILFIGLYAMNRKQYYKIRMQHHKTAVDEALIQKYVDKYWKEVFPNKKVSAGVIVHGNQKIEVIAEIPDLSYENQRELLEKIEIELGGIFAQHLGYQRDFDVSIIVPK